MSKLICNENRIVHEVGDFWVSHEGPGLFCVNQAGLTHSTRVGTYHFADRPEYAKSRAIANAEERASKQ